MLFPIIIPRRYNKDGRWVGPTKNLVHPELAITWVVLNEPASMTYVSHAMARDFEASGIDYEKVAFQNLCEQSEEYLYTHEKKPEFVAMMHKDGLGSSRLLLMDEWNEVFPQGFYFAIPERSCALVVPLDISADRKNGVLNLIHKCFTDGTSPMLDGLHKPEQFIIGDA